MIPHQIQTAIAADFLNISALDRVAWPQQPDTFIPDGEHIWRVWCDFATVLVARLIDANPLEHSGDVAGALVMFPTQSSELFLHKIMVHPDCRGTGIGSELMDAALQQATKPVLLTVDPKNDPAVQLYRNFGFEVRQRVDGYYRSHEDRLLMVFQPAVSS
jgi:ribosomal protein S18 acetylase RimI-like enzyme